MGERLNSSASRRPSALLLIGPTGSGKTPLGGLLEREGLAGRRCCHFDFGARLREAGRSDPAADGLSAAERETVRRVLRTGALLEDHEFGIAEKLLRAFLAERGAGPADVVVLNGLPRHAGQAGKVARLLSVRGVAHLRCGPATVRERIRRNAGGDRVGRRDDSPAEVERKLEQFCARTAPLLAHYASEGVRVVHVEIAAETTARDARAALEREPWPFSSTV